MSKFRFLHSEGNLSNLREAVGVILKNNQNQEELLEEIMSILQGYLLDQSVELGATVWCPPEDYGIPVLVPPIRTIKIESRSVTSNSLTRLKESCIGRFYYARLRHILWVRRLVIWMWQDFYLNYVRAIIFFGQLKSRRWLPIVKLADYVKGSNVSLIKVLDAAKVDTPRPKVFPKKDQTYLASPHNDYMFQPISVAQLTNAQVYGGTNLVFMQDVVICHDLYDFERDYTSEELHGQHVIDPKNMRLRLLKNDATPNHLPVAAPFLDACASNYAHWITEVLPRIAVFCSLKQHENVPLVIDDDLHPNIMESLALVTGKDRKIYLLKKGSAINVTTLYMTSVAGYVPFDQRGAGSLNHAQGMFSPLAFGLVGDKIQNYVNSVASQSWPKKIYLKRTSNYRNVVNEEELEHALLSRGYVVVCPERLSFLQQVILFKHADSIISPTGASICNAIFCQPGAQVIILIGKHVKMSYRYWVNMLSHSGVSLKYIIGNIIDDPSKGVHGNFYVDLNILSDSKFFL